MKRNIFLFALVLSIGLVLFVSSTALENEKKKSELPDKKFKVLTEVWRTPAKSQGKTGTCWCFSTTSFLESEAHRLGRGDFELSEMFTVYHVYLEKALRYVRLHGKNRFGQGGLCHDVVYIMKKYGIVRDSDYSGLKPGETMHKHNEMERVAAGMMEGVVKSGEKKELSSKWIDGRLSSNWFNALCGLLDSYLGKVPKMIEYKGRRISPKQFSDEVLALPFDDYIEITSYSYLPFYKTGELLVPDNWMHCKNYYNVKLNDFVRIIDHALERGYSLVFDLHLTKEDYESLKGYGVVKADSEGVVVSQDMRDTMFEDWRTSDVHLVHAVGIAEDEEGKKFYTTKDSVTSDVGPNKSLEHFSENYVRAKVLSYMINKNGLPDDIREILGIE
jgi:bleomycin hydrolase